MCHWAVPRGSIHRFQRNLQDSVFSRTVKQNIMCGTILQNSGPLACVSELAKWSIMWSYLSKCCRVNPLHLKFGDNRGQIEFNIMWYKCTYMLFCIVENLQISRRDDLDCLISLAHAIIHKQEVGYTGLPFG